MSLSTEFKKGVFYNALGKYSNVIVQLLVNVVLSRILTPNDYGVVTVVNVFLIFFQMLSDMGFGPAIIQNKHLDEEDIESIFSLTIYTSIVLTVIFMLLGYPISLFYANSIYIKICILLGFCIFFYGSLIIPKNLLLKEKNFFIVNIVYILSNIISGIVAITLALNNFSYYALIYSNIANSLFLFICYTYKANIKFNFFVNFDSVKKILGFSKNQFLFSFINYFSRNFDSILIGKYFPPSALGYYDKAYQLSLYPNQLLSSIISPVIQPILADYETKRDVLKRAYFTVVIVLGNIGVSLSVFLFFTAEEIILFLFGNQWINSISSFKILSFSICIQMIASTSGAFYQSSNKTNLLLLSGVQSGITNILAIIIGAYFGKIEYIAFGLVVSFTINFIVNNYLLLYHIFNSNFKELLNVLLKPLFIGMIQMVFFLLMPKLDLSLFANLLIKGVVFVVVFIVGIIVTKQHLIIKRNIRR